MLQISRWLFIVLRRWHRQVKFMRSFPRHWCLCFYLLLFLLERFDRCCTIDEICRCISLQINEVCRMCNASHSTGLIHRYSLLFELLYISHVHVENAWRLLNRLSHWIAFLMAGPRGHNFKDLTTFIHVFFDKGFGRSLLLQLRLNLWLMLFADHIYIKIWDQTFSVRVLLTLFLLSIDMSDCFKTTRVDRILCCL